ncbi:MAG: hypothetical protein A2W95_17565 [Bacteroidetes bacterium GWA2_40_14]|jgi:tetratricopeptide (TPR) repeat protein|nr:MAG: hypothetical protein A2W95_17565 [Bacteroidetes bacterium GWA2_40_14]HAZ01204.1 hypothetical protein [Marinilabiliales bacterium]
MKVFLNAIQKKPFLWLAAILGVTVAIYAPSLGFPFYPNLDDGRLILNNPVVIDFPNQMGTVFSEFVYGLYHPLTTLSFIADYQLFGTNPLGFRLHNLILHLINVLLVFFFVTRLPTNKNVALFAALLFALHPMHMESVIWVSERKDVLFTFFFLLSLLCYLNWHETGKKLWWATATVFFLFSLLSKATAVILPLVLIIVDYIRSGKINWKSIINKWPYFLLSLIFGIVNIKAQQSIDFIQPIADSYSLGQLVTMPVYSFTWYVTQLFAPVGLSIKHLYPRIMDGQMAFPYYLGWLWLLLLAVLTYRFRKGRFFLAGMLFYAVSTVLVIKIIPTGNDLVSDRYSYVPYIGLGLALGSLVIPKLEKLKPIYLYSFFGILLTVLGFASWNYSKHWESEIAIWSRVITTEPELPLAYFERGKAHQDKKDYQNAIQDYRQTLQLAPNFYQSYIQLGICYYLTQQNDVALSQFSAAVTSEPKNAMNYYHRGFLLTKMGNFSEAVSDFNQSISLGCPVIDIYYQKGLAEKQLGHWEASTQSFTTFLEEHPDHWSALTELASVYYQTQQFQLAATIYKKLESLEPGNIQIAYFLANTLARLELYNEAIGKYNVVIEARPDFGPAYLNRGNVYHLMGDNPRACDDWQQALKLDVTQAERMITTYCR